MKLLYHRERGEKSKNFQEKRREEKEKLSILFMQSMVYYSIERMPMAYSRFGFMRVPRFV